MLAHVASKEGIVAAEVIAGEPTALDQQAIPAAVFTDPEIGTVGMTEEEAEADGFDPVVGEMPFNASGRAMTTGHTTGVRPARRRRRDRVRPRRADCRPGGLRS